jgi:hypothetical protein
VTRVERRGTRMEYATHERVWWFGPQNPGGGSEEEQRHMATSGSSRRGEATDEEARWPSDEDDIGLDHNALGLSGLTQLYPRAKLRLCNSPVK